MTRGVLLFAALALWLWPSLAAACSVCIAGDSAYSVLGNEADHPDRLRLSNENLWIEKRQEQEEHMEWRSYQGVAYGVSDALTLVATVPWVWKQLREDGESLTTRGVGDVEIFGRYTVWQDRYLAPRHVFRTSAGMQAPTGNYWMRSPLESPEATALSSPAGGPTDTPPRSDRLQAQHAGEVHAATANAGPPLAPEHAQIGTGAFVGVAGADYQYWREKYLATSGIFVRVPGRSPRGFRYGPSVVASGALQYEVSRDFTLGGGPVYRYAGQDRIDGSPDRSSGGHVLYLEPAVSGRFLSWLSARGKVAVPVWESLYGDQDERPVYSLALQADVPL